MVMGGGECDVVDPGTRSIKFPINGNFHGNLAYAMKVDIDGNITINGTQIVVSTLYQLPQISTNLCNIDGEVPTSAYL